MSGSSFNGRSNYTQGNIRIDKDSGVINTTNDIKSLLDLLDYIQKRYAVESKSKILHTAQDLFTTKDFFNVFKIGFKDVVSFEFLTLIFFLYPIYLLYESGFVILFPNVDERWVVTFLIYLFTFSTQIFFLLFVYYMTRNYYDGVSPRKTVSAYAWGRVTGYIVKIILFLAFFGFLYYLLGHSPSFLNKLVYFLSNVTHEHPMEVYKKVLVAKSQIFTDMFKVPGIVFIFLLGTVILVKYHENYYQKHLKDKIGKGKHDYKHKEGHIHLGWGYRVYPLNKKLIPIYQSDKSRNYNTGIVGQIGVGKTFTLMNRVKYDILNGDNVVVIDPKGSGDLFNFVLEWTIRAGRLKDFIYINPVYPEYSSKINPLAYYSMPEVIINTVLAGIRVKDEFYLNIAREVTSIIVYGLIEISKYKRKVKPDFTFDDIKSWLSAPKLEEMKNVLMTIETPTAEKLVSDIEQILATSSDNFAKVGASLRTVLTSLSIGSVGAIIGRSTENDFVKRLMEGKGVILFVETASLLMKDTSSIIGKVLLSNLASIAGYFYAQRKKLPRKLKVHVDEFYTQAFIGVENLFDKGREVGIHMDVYFQSISQLDAELGSDRAKVVLENINNYMIMRIKSPETAQKFAEIIGMGKDLLTNYHSDGSVTMMEREDWRVYPADFIRLENREFIFHTGETDYRGFTVDVDPPILQVEMPKLSTKAF